mmetsp:Transcript_24998/g.71875  ORF Transcript_24998/g.71875 Transcript_24998/m.71875 type:complete len:207 (-) Transcript_24998:4357-4977(-)
MNVVSMRRYEVTRLLSMDGMPGASLHSSRMKGNAYSQTLRHHFARFSACLGKRGIKFSFHVSMSGFHPRCTGSKYTMPQRLTVAGDATAKSLTSNMMVMLGGNLMRSPLDKQSILLSSSTVFMFSIHTASTGPSSMTHCLLLCSAVAAKRTAKAKMPSVHSCVFSSKSPYNSPCLIDFGFILCISTGKYKSPSATAASASAKTNSI